MINTQKFEIFFKVALLILLAVIAVNTMNISNAISEIDNQIFDLTNVIMNQD